MCYWDESSLFHSRLESVQALLLPPHIHWRVVEKSVVLVVERELLVDVLHGTLHSIATHIKRIHAVPKFVLISLKLEVRRFHFLKRLPILMNNLVHRGFRWIASLLPNLRLLHQESIFFYQEKMFLSLFCVSFGEFLSYRSL